MVTGQTHLLERLPHQTAVTTHLFSLGVAGAAQKRNAGSFALGCVDSSAAHVILQHGLTALLPNYSACF